MERKNLKIQYEKTPRITQQRSSRGQMTWNGGIANGESADT